MTVTQIFPFYAGLRYRGLDVIRWILRDAQRHGKKTSGAAMMEHTGYHRVNAKRIGTGRLDGASVESIPEIHPVDVVCADAVRRCEDDDVITVGYLVEVYFLKSRAFHMIDATNLRRLQTP